MLCSACGNIGSSQPSWKGTLTHVSTQEIVGASTTEVRNANVTRDYDEGASGGGLLLTFRPSGTWTYNRNGSAGGCTLIIPTTNRVLSKDVFQGVLQVDPGKLPMPYEAAIGTGDFEGKQSLICPDPAANHTVNLPLNEQLLYVTRNNPFTVSREGDSIKGSYSEGGNTYEWDLSTRDPIAQDPTFCLGVCSAYQMGCQTGCELANPTDPGRREVCVFVCDLSAMICRLACVAPIL